MKPVRLIGAGVLLLLLGAVAPTYAQEQEAKPPKQEQQAKPQKQQQAKSARQEQQQQAKGQQEQQKQQQQQAKSARQEQQQQARGQQAQQKQQQQQAKSARQEQQQQARGQQANRPSQQGQRVQQGEQQAVWQEHRAHNWQSEHRDWRQRGGYNGYRIPDDRYRGNFGRNHSFRLDRYPMEVYDGYPRFQYGGFWFGLLDPWPEYWSNDWYDNDDVYIVYSDDGYYLYNRRYPQDRIAITVYVN